MKIHTFAICTSCLAIWPKKFIGADFCPKCYMGTGVVEAVVVEDFSTELLREILRDANVEGA